MSAPHPRLRKLAVLVAIITSFGVGIPTSASASTTASATSASTATALPPAATASAHSTTQPKNRVRDFCFGTADRASGNHGLSRQQHSENYDASAALASGSPLAAKGGGAWKFGGHKSATKWANQLSKRGWTPEQITQALKGKQFPAKNLVNPKNPATRFVHPESGKSVVIDDITEELLHVGGEGFKY